MSYLFGPEVRLRGEGPAGGVILHVGSESKEQN